MLRPDDILYKVLRCAASWSPVLVANAAFPTNRVPGPQWRRVTSRGSIRNILKTLCGPVQETGCVLERRAFTRDAFVVQKREPGFFCVTRRAVGVRCCLGWEERRPIWVAHCCCWPLLSSGSGTPCSAGSSSICPLCLGALSTR